MKGPPLTLVRDEHEQANVAELVEVYLEHRLRSVPQLSGSRVITLSRALRTFAEVVGTTSLDEGAVKRWVTSRSHLASRTLYYEFCDVRALCRWLADRRFIKPINWTSQSWPRSTKSKGRRHALKEARLAEALFEEYLYGVGLAERTITEYVYEVARARSWLEERGHTLDEAPARVIAAYVESRPASWSTRKMVRATLQHYWTMTGREQPPVKALRVPPKPRGHCRALEDDVSALLAEAARNRGDDPGLAVCLMLYAGLRRTEVARLRWENFDRSVEWLTVVGKFGIQATIPVHPRLRQLLLAKERGEDYIFPGRFSGQPSASHRIYHWVQLVAREAGVPDVTPHRLRHVAVATVNDNTGDLRAAQDFARHADPRTTAIYTRTTERRLRSAVEAIDY